MARTLLSLGDIRGAWTIIPTPAKEGASDWRATKTVDLDETKRVVNGLIEAGIDGFSAWGRLAKRRP